MIPDNKRVARLWLHGSTGFTAPVELPPGVTRGPEVEKLFVSLIERDAKLWHASVAKALKAYGAPLGIAWEAKPPSVYVGYHCSHKVSFSIKGRPHTVVESMVACNIKAIEDPYAYTRRYALQPPVFEAYPSWASRTKVTATGPRFVLTPQMKEALDLRGVEEGWIVLPGKRGGPITAEAVRGFVRGLRTWFQEDYSPEDADRPGGGGYLHYGTRDHGIRDDDSDRAGPADIAEAARIKKALREEFGSALRVEVTEVDEWTNLNVVWK